jgi:hypothetical protein
MCPSTTDSADWYPSMGGGREDLVSTHSTRCHVLSGATDVTRQLMNPGVYRLHIYLPAKLLAEKICFLTSFEAILTAKKCSSHKNTMYRKVTKHKAFF